MSVAIPMARYQLGEEWIDFLQRWNWQWFTTHTFPEDIHPEAADKAFRYWASKINRQLWGPRWSKKGRGIFWARALEYQKRGVIHFHALVAGVDDLRRLSWMDRWYEITGGYARIEAIRSTEAVTAYCSKYVTKDGEIELSKSLVDSVRNQGRLLEAADQQKEQSPAAGDARHPESGTTEQLSVA